MRGKVIMSRILLCIISFLLVFSAVSCDDKNTDDETTDTTNNDLQTKDLSLYSVVRGELTSETEISAAQHIKKFFNDEYSINLAITTDWKVKTEYDPNSYEIIVGVTDYTESKQLKETLTRLDYSIVLSGNKIVILGGSDEKTLQAAQYFTENLILKSNDKVTLKSEENVLVKGEYKYNETDISVISLNLKAAKNAQQNYQAQREPLIISFVEEKKPYSVGFQECENFWLSRLEGNFTNYTTAHKIPGTKNNIFYNKNLVTLVQNGVFWLSETPDVASYGFGSTFMISCAWAIFEVKATGARYVHMNTHLDYTSAEIRDKEVVVLIKRMNGFIDMGYAVIVTGDFNAYNNSTVYAQMTANMKDSRVIAPVTTNIGTYNNFDINRTYTGPIDYCFINKEIKAYKYFVVDKYKNSFLSDHNALYVELCIYNR